jgi:hypothetical protein
MLTGRLCRIETRGAAERAIAECIRLMSGQAIRCSISVSARDQLSAALRQCKKQISVTACRWRTIVYSSQRL